MKSMEQNSRRPIRVYTLIVCALTVAAILLRTLDLRFFYDKEIGYYQKDALLPMVETALLWGGLLAFAVLSLILRKRIAVRYETIPSLSIRISGAIAAILPIVYAATRLFTEDVSPLLSRITLALSMVVAAYYLLHAAKSEAPILPRFVTGICTILWFMLSLAASYFDITVQMNAPHKLIFQFACLGAMLFTVGELRVFLDHPHSSLYLFSAGCATLFLGTASVPSLILGFMGMIEKSSWFWGNLILFGAFVYTVTRLITLCFSKDEAEIPQQESNEIETEEEASAENTDTEEPSEDTTPNA